jgi:translation initiation factor 2 gamma subunit (eIF-2gamma)
LIDGSLAFAQVGVEVDQHALIVRRIASIEAPGRSGLIVTMMVMGNTVQNTYWNIVASFDTTGQTPQQISCHQAHYNCGGDN